MNKKRSIILFDIDYTLLDSAKLKNLFNQEVRQILRIKKENLGKLRIQEFTKKLKNSIEFSPCRYIRFLQDKTSGHFPKKELEKLFFENSICYQRSLYLETMPILGQLKKKFYLGIFSEGVREFQRAKLELSGLIDYLDKKLVFIYSNKMGRAELLVEKLGKIYIVDDDPKHIAALAKIKGVSSIWIKRGPWALSDKKLAYKPVFSLKEIRTRLL